MSARSLVLFLVLSTVSLTATACDSESPTEPTTPEPSALVALLAPPTFTLGVGDTAQIRASASLRDGSEELVTTSGTWQSSDPGIVTVDGAGIVRGIAPGSAEVTVVRDSLTATIAVTVTTGGAAPTRLSGAAAAPGSETATFTVTIDASGRAVATVYFASTIVDLIGRLDPPTGTVHVTGAGYTFLGTLSGQALTGTFQDPSGSTGTFAAVDATHTAVTPFCGSYSSGGGSGSIALALSLDGLTAGASAPDSGGTPITLIGSRSGDTLTLTTDLGGSANGTVQGDTIAGRFDAASGSTADFTARTSSCH